MQLVCHCPAGRWYQSGRIRISQHGAGRRGTALRAKHSDSHDDAEYDLFTIGGGSAGVRAARFSADLGKSPASPDACNPMSSCMLVM
jgi:alkyl hydroperoxide reductase subunit AhpF